jgi:hypothetical protein
MKFVPKDRIMKKLLVGAAMIGIVGFTGVVHAETYGEKYPVRDCGPVGDAATDCVAKQSAELKIRLNAMAADQPQQAAEAYAKLTPEAKMKKAFALYDGCMDSALRAAGGTDAKGYIRDLKMYDRWANMCQRYNPPIGMNLPHSSEWLTCTAPGTFPPDRGFHNADEYCTSIYPR